MSVCFLNSLRESVCVCVLSPGCCCVFDFDFAVFLGVCFLLTFFSFFFSFLSGHGAWLWALGSLARHQAWASRVGI